jgi:hypothetical protein
MAEEPQPPAKNFVPLLNIVSLKDLFATFMALA